jgi:hypothetical protein
MRLAIPGTGKRSGHYAWHRRPRNAAAKRALLASCGTLRGVAVPPSDYDDINRCVQRSWKEHRPTKWRTT